MLSALTTIVDNGPAANRIDAVFLGDGYTAAELDTAYVAHIDAMLDHLFRDGEDPFPRYESFFNVYRVNTASLESGADVPPLGIYRQTAFDARYYWDGTTERLLYVDEGKVYSELDTAFAGLPFSSELTLVTVNSSRYGGGGGSFAVYAGGNGNAPEVALHELGHSFGKLADEYGGNTGVYTGVEPAAVNVTKSASVEKWSHWLGYSEPGVGAIGAYEGAGYYDQGLYRPSLSSKMRSLSKPFDAVSREQLILEMYALVDPLDGWLSNAQAVTAPHPTLWVDTIDPDVIDVEWYVDGIQVPEASGESFAPADFGVVPGTYQVTARGIDNTDWVRIHRDQLEQSITWTVTVSAPLTAPTPQAPVGVVVDGNRDFQWAPIPDAVRYDLWVNDVTTGQSGFIRQQQLSTTSYPASTLVAGHTYQWAVRAFDQFDVPGDWSPTATVTLMGTPIAQKPISTTQTGFPVFQWEAVDGVALYDLWVNDLTTGQVGVIRNRQISENTYTHTTELPAGHSYLWTVRAMSPDGVFGQWATAQSFVVVGIPALQSPTASTPDTRPTFHWSTAGGAARYDLWVNDMTTGQSQVIREKHIFGTSYSATEDLKLGHTYQWTVRAVSPEGAPGEWAAIAEFTLMGTPVAIAPVGLVHDLSPVFSWTATAGAVRYELWVNDLTTNESAVIHNTNITENQALSPMPLTDGHNYLWAVRAFNIDGNPGAWSPAVQFDVAVNVPAPTLLSPIGTNVGVTPTFSWTPIANAARYELWVNDLTTGQSAIIRTAQIETTNYSAPFSLVIGHSYIWTVRGISSAGSLGTWGQHVIFTIE